MGQQGLLRHVREFEPAAGLDCMAADEVPGERQDIVAALAQGSKRYWNYCEAKKKIFAKAPSSYLVLQFDFALLELGGETCRTSFIKSCRSSGSR